MMSKKRRIPISADGIRLKKGFNVFYLWTTNGGKTWHVGQDIIIRTNQRGMVKLASLQNAWSYARPLSEMVGDHRIYATESNAKKEAISRSLKMRAPRRGDMTR